MLVGQLGLADIRCRSVLSPWWPLPECHLTSIDESRGSRATSAMISRLATHRFPFGYRELVPYYEWVETTLPIATAPMGLKEKHFFEGAERLGLPFQAGKDITQIGFRPQQNAILQPRRIAGRTGDVSRLRFPEAFGCTFCGHCSQGCFEPLGAPVNLKAKRSTSVSYIPMALTADRWSRHGKPVTLMADAFAIKVGLDPFGAARRLTWRI